MGSPIYFAYLKNNSRGRQFYKGKPRYGTEFARYIQEKRNSHHVYKIHVSEDHPARSSNLVMLGHRPHHLAIAIRQSLSFPSGAFKVAELGRKYEIGPHALAPSQRRGVREYIALKRIPYNDPEDDRTLEKYYNAFNKIFFFGALKNMCAIRLAPFSHTLAGQCISHRTSNSFSIPQNSACLIEIMDKSMKTPSIPEDDRLRDYIETLLHEMLHAFFAIYTCDCGKCKSNNLRWLGNGGHQSAWQNAAFTLEVATEKLLGMRLDMARLESLNNDSDHFGNSDTQLHDFEHWHNLRFAVIGDRIGDFNVDEEDDEYEHGTEDQDSEEEEDDDDDEIHTEYDKGSKRSRLQTQRESRGSKRARRGVK